MSTVASVGATASTCCRTCRNARLAPMIRLGASTLAMSPGRVCGSGDTAHPLVLRGVSMWSITLSAPFIAPVLLSLRSRRQGYCVTSPRETPDRVGCGLKGDDVDAIGGKSNPRKGDET